ncbi:MAG: inositol 2-dehydrogenase [Treponemataceae bacterium]
MVKLGIIGAGRIGKVHAQSIQNLVSDATVVAITDVAKAAAEEASKLFGIPKVYDTYQELLDDKEIDAVMVCSSTDTHAQISIEAAQKGKHIFCEKPIDPNIDRIIEVQKAVEKAGVQFQTGFNRRFDKNFKRVKELSTTGALGNIEIIKITSRDPAPPPVSYIKVSGGLFMDMMIHDFDMACFQAGSPVTEVYAKGAVRVDPEIGKAGDIDTALVTLSFENGIICVIDNSRRACYGYDQRLEVFGSKGAGCAENERETNVSILTENGVISDKPVYFFLERYMQAYGDEVKSFVESIIKNKPVQVGLDAGLWSIVIAKAAKKSLEENRPVKISEIYK